MEQCPWEASSHPVSPKSSVLLWNTKVYYWTTGPLLRLINPLTLQVYLLILGLWLDFRIFQNKISCEDFASRHKPFTQGPLEKNITTKYVIKFLSSLCSATQHELNFRSHDCQNPWQLRLDYVMHICICNILPFSNEVQEAQICKRQEQLHCKLNRFTPDRILGIVSR